MSQSKSGPEARSRVTLADGSSGQPWAAVSSSWTSRLSHDYSASSPQQLEKSSSRMGDSTLIFFQEGIFEAIDRVVLVAAPKFGEQRTRVRVQRHDGVISLYLYMPIWRRPRYPQASDRWNFASLRSSSSIGRPPLRPRARALARPAWVRSQMNSCSNPVSAPRMRKIRQSSNSLDYVHSPHLLE